jgi:general secretion pathway protein D
MRILKNGISFLLAASLIVVGFYFPFHSLNEAYAETESAEKNSADPVSEKETVKQRGPAVKSHGKEKKVTFNFVDVEIPVVVKFISEVTGKNFVFDDKVKGVVTIIAPAKLSVDDAFNLFTSVLELKGFTIIPSGKVYKIIPLAEAKQSGTDTELQKDGKIIVSDTYITRLIPLQAISSSQAMSFLQPLISRNGHISSFGPGNMLLIVDSSANIEKILKILEIIDKAGVEEPELVILQYANAEDVVKILNESLVSNSKSQPSSLRPPRPGESSIAVSVDEAKATVFADTRLNAVVMIADKQEKEAMKRMIALLDIPLTQSTSKINVYFLEYADATELSKVLEGMMSGISTQMKPGVAVQPGQTARSPFEAGGRVIIAPDKATNSLIIVASPADYQNLLHVVKQLDRRRKQVYVEAMIVEASIDKLQELGAQWRYTIKKNNEPVFIGGFGKIDSTSMQNIVSGLTGLTAGGMGNFLNVPITTIGSDGTATNTTLTIPGYAALFSLNEFKGTVNVLSTPQILTSDNKEAEILVGENVPFISQREQNSTTTNTINSIERKDVGITLRLTPQITEGDFVKLDLYQEISSVKNASDTILINVGPTTTKRSTKTSVVVKDNQTVVIGGLMEERETVNVNKLPLLGDIPVIGWFFKNESKEKTKTNLLVFLTPHIVKEANQLVKLSESKRMDFAKSAKRYIQGELLVKFKGQVSEARISEILSAEGETVLSAGTPQVRPYLIKLKDGQDIQKAIEIFSQYPEVEYAEPNYMLKIQAEK